MNAKSTDCILVINTGSSSVKFQLFLKSPSLVLLARGSVSHLGGEPQLSIATNSGLALSIDKKMLPINSTHEDGLKHILAWVESQHELGRLVAVAHRVVHGGTEFKQSLLLTPEILERLWKLCPLAPLHQPHNLMAIKIIAALKPDIPQIACFDTAFHANHEPLFTTYALPQKLRDEGIRRYGFHGLSYEWIAYTLLQNESTLAAGRVVAAHLGNGASLCAIHNGVSIDTTMGMTALDGLPMGTRCGSLDPGAVIYMVRELGMSADEVEAILYQESGLVGLSEWTNDVSLLQNSRKPKAQFAIAYYCLKAAQSIGMMAVALGGVDGIIFTGGIGENSIAVRDAILKRLEFLKPFETQVIPANEERMMVIHSLSILE
ncbi:acetate/propionate family kinase [Legionella hackeliae]|uniref:Acetate kinase n=1 Tax=Legionella hackeliae TaxID=449 RepID=A0A0A8URT1_LEGHA|nr:acetate/propionate family kinase [Legionella hackeliae]KTD13134.1 acetate kinase [Legionella hackeliae]CEK11555.1 Acetate kinase [Legionella hackeliae]STX48326.1 Acetate kinase (Acetokinase) [Legionella hackeliae]